MRYNPKARLDRSQMEVRRGGGGGGGGMRMPGGGNGMKVGGGIGGLIILVIVLVLQSQLGGSGSAGPSGPSGADAAPASSLDGCRTGADANQSRDCAMLADVNSIQAFWESTLPDQTGREYREAVTTVFTGSVSTGCGNATDDVGPFYCPVDEHIYLDPTFFEEMLQGQLGAEGGLFSEAYVLAHEYGHHVQNLLGTLGQVRTQQGPTSDAVRLELQADCYAGMWTKFATEVPDDSGQPYILDLTDEDIRNGLDAARAVGDDRIQQRSGGRVDPDRWTHGSSEQRMRWFRTGLERGTVEACDTFSARTL